MLFKSITVIPMSIIRSQCSSHAYVYSILMFTSSLCFPIFTLSSCLFYLHVCPIFMFPMFLPSPCFSHLHVYPVLMFILSKYLSHPYIYFIPSLCLPHPYSHAIFMMILCAFLSHPCIPHCHSNVHLISMFILSPC